MKNEISSENAQKSKIDAVKRTAKGILCALLGSSILFAAACSPFFEAEYTDPAESDQYYDGGAQQDNRPEIINHPDIEISANVGFGGFYQMLRWTNVYAEITNTGEDFEGKLIVPTISEYSGSTIEYSVPAHIPSGSSKVLEIPICFKTIERYITVKLERDGEIVEQINLDNITATAYNTKLIGTLSDDSEALLYWKDRGNNLQVFSSFETVALSSSTFPDSVQKIGGFTIIVIDDFDVSTLNEKQREALSEWVENGGTLVVGSGPSASKTLQGISDIVSIEYSSNLNSTGVAQAMASASKTTPMDAEPSIVKLGKGKSSIFTTPIGTQILELYEVEEGKVIAASFELGKKPFSTWRGAMQFWQSVFIETQDAKDWTNVDQYEYYSMGYNPFLQALENIPSGAMPNITLISAVIVLFAVAAGPMLYLLLKKKDKRDWAWVAIPALSVLFTLIVFAFTFRQERDRTEASTVTVINHDDISSGTMSYVGVLSPHKGDRELTLRREGMLKEEETYDGYGGYYSRSSDSETYAKINQTANPSILYSDQSAWSMTYAALSSSAKEAGKIEGTLGTVDGAIEGKLTNNTGYDLEQLILVGTSSYQSFEGVAKGETVDVSMKHIIPSQTQQIYSSVDMLYNVRSSLFPYPHEYENDEQSIYHGADVEFQRSMLSKAYVFDGLINSTLNQQFSKYSGRICYAIAFNNEVGAFPVEINGTPSDKTYHMGVVLNKIDLEFESNGRFMYPYGVLQGKALAGESDPSLYSDNYGVSFVASKQVVSAIDIPDYSRYKIEEFSIQCLPQYDGKLKLYLWDFSKKPMTTQEIEELRSSLTLFSTSNHSNPQLANGTVQQTGDQSGWVEIKSGKKMTAADVSKFIHSSGMIKMLVESDPSAPNYYPDNYQRITIPTLSMKGEVK